MKEKTRNQILVVGGGFGGLKVALELSRRKECDVTLISDKLDYCYSPTLYHTATGGLFRQSSIPLKEILEGSPIHFVHGKAIKLNREKQTIETNKGHVIGYDKLILALGAVTNYFGIPGLEKFSYSITTMEEVARFKAHLHKQLDDGGRPDLNYLIVGGGPTGVELAGALPSYLREIMKNHNVVSKKLHISLIEAAPRLLPRSAPRVSRAVAKRLKKLGVKLYLGEGVKGEVIDGLMVGSAKIPSQTVVWAVGTTNNAFFKENSFSLTERSKVEVDGHLQAEENIYVIGDNANTPFSGMAQTALYDAQYVAHDIEAKLHGNEGSFYRPKSPTSVIPVGPGWAAFEYKWIIFSGWLGWFVRQAADWIGYHELEPWWKANGQWMTEFGEEEDCPVCAKRSS